MNAPTLFETIKTAAVKEEREIRKVLPPNSTFPTIHGKWKRRLDSNIVAWYTADELHKCEQVANALDESSGYRF